MQREQIKQKPPSSSSSLSLSSFDRSVTSEIACLEKLRLKGYYEKIFLFLGRTSKE